MALPKQTFVTMVHPVSFALGLKRTPKVLRGIGVSPHVGKSRERSEFENSLALPL